MWNITKKIQGFVDENDTILDIMCGRCDPTRDLKAKIKVGIDLYRPALDIAAISHIPIHADVSKVSEMFLPKTFDVVLWMNAIEHLEKESAIETLEALEIIARKRVIVYAPTHFFDNKDSDEYKNEGDLQEHRSYWPLDFWQTRGYRLIQFYNKDLINEMVLVKKEPK